MDEVTIHPASPERFDSLLPADQAAAFSATLRRTQEVLDGRTIWHANSTDQGGGVAEMLQSLLGYLLGGGIHTRWLVMSGNERFFELTKRLHYLLHGEPADGEALGEEDRAVYQDTLAPEAEQMAELVRPGDAVVLHDPQTVGLARPLSEAGAHVIWSCHIGCDEANSRTRSAWRFLLPYVEHSAAQGFSRSQHVWSVLDRSRVVIIPPCLDPFSPKNQHLDHDTVTAIVGAAAIIRADGQSSPDFVRQDGRRGRVCSEVEMIEDVPLPASAPVVVQISRWDRLKDHAGVMTGFTEHVPFDAGAHLVLAGPAPDSIVDDPESQQTLAELQDEREALAVASRRRVHLACLPMDDLEENAAVVNALQRRSDVVVQKSLAEGFGLTVAEAMWKARPTIGSNVGGIQDQIEHGRSGVLIDPSDLPSLGRAITGLLEDRRFALRMGVQARDRVIQAYLAPCYLSRYLRLIDELCSQ